MSRRLKRKKRSQPEKPSQAETPAQEKPAATSDSQKTPPPSDLSRTRLRIAAAVSLVWLLFLVGLIWASANPVMLNRLQILQSDFVVTATVTDPQKGTLDIEKEWKQGADLQIRSVPNLHQTPAQKGEKYLIPLSPTSARRLQVTPTRLPEHRPLIYPATPAARRQLTELLQAP